MKRPNDCFYLQNKAFFFPPPLPVDEPDRPEIVAPPTSLSTPCWCLRTHEAIGPDGEEAHPELCVPGRACHRPEVDLGA
ncbi:MAG: hypothetical protein D6731_16905 [Planctomycetota bacterium]|nr:MAG: hypothetical protein D6731_16905 [Planctomycetota bacterium]